jgi:hypothetical protein
LSLTSSQMAARLSDDSDDLVESSLLAHAANARTERHVLVDRLGERVRLLEDHADASADLNRIDLRRVEVYAVIG